MEKKGEVSDSNLIKAVEEAQIRFVFQLLRYLEEAEIRFENAYKRKDYENFNKLKRIVLQIQNKISEELV